MGNGAYTQEGIMFQILVAFGQGTGATRVSQDAAVALRDLYFNAITNEIVTTRWGAEGGQALERVRALGRLAAFKALQRGDSKIVADDVTSSAPTVHTTSDTEFCPPRP
jgi:hypothetical protein